MTDMLDPVVHKRILQDEPGVCNRASIHPAWLHRSAVEVCQPGEIDWLLHFRQYQTQGVPGLKITGPNALHRCMAMAGALIRNFIDARVKTVDELIDLEVEATCMLVPNFYVASNGKGLVGWRVQKLYDRLLDRYKQGHPTVLWMESEIGVREYGPAMTDLIEQYVRA